MRNSPMDDDFHLVPGIPEEILCILVPYVPGIVVSDLRDDVPSLKDSVSGGPKPYLSQNKKR